MQLKQRREAKHVLAALARSQASVFKYLSLPPLPRCKRLFTPTIRCDLRLPKLRRSSRSALPHSLAARRNVSLFSGPVPQLELAVYLLGAFVCHPAHSLPSAPAAELALTRYDSLFRYVRLWVNLASNWTYTPMQPVDDPTITSKDMTVIIPTVAEDLQQLKETVQSAYRLEPFELLLVTPDSRVKRVYQMVEELGSPKIIQVLSVSQANKRRQLCRAIPEVETKITLLLDDDVWLPEKFTKWILAPFEDPRVGGVGTNQQIRRFNRSNIWEFLGAIYLVRRNFDCTACNWIDGGLPCLSGRAVAYRSEILQDPNFTYGFTHETWGSDHFLNADDDNFITRWLFSHNWKIQMQNHRECEVETTLEDDSKYLRQCLRWVRSNWRSNLTSLTEGYMWVVSY